jgi:putative oxidoreductase
MAAGVSTTTSSSMIDAHRGIIARATEGLVPYAPSILRVVVGFIFVNYGINKFANPDGFATFVGSLGFPTPTVFGYFVMGLEALGGAALILGLLVRPIALLFLIEMTVTSWLVKLPRGIAPAEGGAGLELDLALWAAAAVLVILGPGRLSVDRDVIRREFI